MNRFRFFLFVLIFLWVGKFTECTAQKVRLGIRAGGQISTRAEYKEMAPFISYHAGVMLRVGITEKHRFQVELLYSKRGLNSNLYRNPYLDLPLLYNRKMFKVMYAEGGIQPSLYVKMPEYRHGFGVPTPTGTSDIAIIVGTGIEIKKIHIGIRGLYGLINQSFKNAYTVVDPNDPIYQNFIKPSHNVSLMLTAGFVF